MYFGVQNGDACYCGNDNSRFLPVPASECDQSCTGDRNQICGSSWRLSVYESNINTTTTQSMTSTNESTTSTNESTTSTNKSISSTSQSLTTTARKSMPTTRQTTAETTAKSPFQKAVLTLKASETEKLSMIIGFDGKT